MYKLVDNVVPHWNPPSHPIHSFPPDFFFPWTILAPKKSGCYSGPPTEKTGNSLRMGRILLLVHVHVGTVPLIIIRRRDEMGGAMGGWDPLIIHPPRPIPDVEDWETLLQAMRRGSYLALALALCLLWVEIWVEVCVCVRYVCVCVCYVTDQIFFC